MAEGSPETLSYGHGEHLPSCLLSTPRNFSVEMYFRNDSKKAPWPLILPGCSHRCPLQDFLRLTESVIPKDWQKECQLTSDTADTGELPPASVLIMSWVSVKITSTKLQGAVVFSAIFLPFPGQPSSTLIPYLYIIPILHLQVILLSLRK